MTGVVVTAWELQSGVAATAAVAAKRRTTSNVFRIYRVLPKNIKNSSPGQDAGGVEKSPLDAIDSRFETELFSLDPAIHDPNLVSLDLPSRSAWCRGEGTAQLLPGNLKNERSTPVTICQRSKISRRLGGFCFQIRDDPRPSEVRLAFFLPDLRLICVNLRLTLLRLVFKFQVLNVAQRQLQVISQY
jgi:hypothetical protein